MLFINLNPVMDTVHYLKTSDDDNGILVCNDATAMIYVLKKGSYIDNVLYSCGDICTHQTFPCQCGNITCGAVNTQHPCCLSPDDHCTHDG